jgi:hypothetical protein
MSFCFNFPPHFQLHTTRKVFYHTHEKFSNIKIPSSDLSHCVCMYLKGIQPFLPIICISENYKRRNYAEYLEYPNTHIGKSINEECFSFSPSEFKISFKGITFLCVWMENFNNYWQQPYIHHFVSLSPKIITIKNYSLFISQ